MRAFGSTYTDDLGEVLHDALPRPLSREKQRRHPVRQSFSLSGCPQTLPKTPLTLPSTRCALTNTMFQIRVRFFLFHIWGVVHEIASAFLKFQLLFSLGAGPPAYASRNAAKSASAPGALARKISSPRRASPLPCVQSARPCTTAGDRSSVFHSACSQVRYRRQG